MPRVQIEVASNAICVSFLSVIASLLQRGDDFAPASMVFCRFCRVAQVPLLPENIKAIKGCIRQVVSTKVKAANPRIDLPLVL